jgi:hypothetical protein
MFICESDVVVVYSVVRHVENLHLPVFFSNHKLYSIEKRDPQAGIHEMNRAILGYFYIS